MGPDPWTRGYSPYTSVPHLTALQKAYLLQLFFYPIHYVQLSRKKVYQKAKNTV